MIRMVIAEDQKMMRGALVSLLKLEDDIAVIAEVSDGVDAWNIVTKQQPEVCVLDIEIPGITGLEIAEKVRTRGQSCKIRRVTTFARPG
ncbi:response regulator transcription factor, partial [Bacillus pseudomycoides]|uniref:response regulator n=1 Tax=Bacillus pseudomycoides TaxID=64104 RepID=UPI00284CAE3D